MLVLAGDVGGTHCRLALVESAASDAAPKWNVRRAQTYASAEHETLGELLVEFVGGDAVEAAAFGVAGPVLDGVAQLTNVSWVVRERALGDRLGVPVRLLNDFHAAALGVRHEVDAGGELELIQEGSRDPTGPRLVIGAGTGLGKAIDVAGQILTSEGGHVGFAPRSAEEIELLQHLATEHARVSVERVVSGPGLAALHAFRSGEAAITSGAGVAAAAASGDVLARQVLAWFVELYGAEAGNFALTTLPTGGLFITGGIAPKLVAQMGSEFGERFRTGFLAKGRMSGLLASFHVSVVLEKRVGLLGAAAAAREALQR